MKCLRCFLLFLFAWPGTSVAHQSNDLAYAPIMEPITVDGDLSDWPEQALRYPIINVNPNVGPTDLLEQNLLNSPDLTAYFMVDYNLEEQLFYVAVSALDDSLVIGTEHWNQDAEEIYVDGDHSGGFIEQPELNHLQYVVVPGNSTYHSTYEDNPLLFQGDIKKTRTKAAFKRQGKRTTYEWAVQAFDRYPDMPTRLEPGKVLGFDVVLRDKDDDDAQSQGAWVSWNWPAISAGGLKWPNADLQGHLLLGEERPTVLGHLTGVIRNEQGPVSGVLVEVYWQNHALPPHPQKYPRVGVTRSGPDGTFKLAARKGTYIFQVRSGQGYKADQATDIEIQPGVTAHAELVLTEVEVPPIVKHLAATYAEASGYQDSFTVEMTTTNEGVDIETLAPLRFAWKPPDQVRMEGWIEEKTLIVSDGDSTFYYLGSFNQYMQRPVPEPLTYNGLRGPLPGLGVAGQSVMSGKADFLTRGLEQAEVTGQETIDGHRCAIVELTQTPITNSLAAATFSQEPLTLTLWISEEDFTLRKASYAYQGNQTTEHYHRPDLDPRFNENTFVFIPPDGAERTDFFGAGKEKKLIGQPAPDFSLKDYQDQDVSLADFAGQVLVIDFWGTWCPPCLEAMPKLVALHEQYADQGFTIIGIATGDSPEAVKKFAAKHQVDFPLPLADDQVPQAYQISAFPTTFVVDRSGIVRFAQIGEPEDFSAFERQVKQLLEE